MLLGPLIIVTPATAVAQPSCDGSVQHESFQDKVGCWADQVQRGERVEVELRQPLELGGQTSTTMWSHLERVDRGPGELVVSVPGGNETGTGGTVLMILATSRLVADDSKITMLHPQTLSRLRKLGEVCDDLCDKVDRGRAPAGGADAGETVSGQEVLAGGLAEELPESGSRTIILAALLLLAALLGAVVYLSRGVRTSTGPQVAQAPRPVPAPPYRRPEIAPQRQPKRRPGRRAVIPNGPRRSATVRSDLHPEGYVEVDRCLFRAVWTDDQAAAPEVGEPVDVVQGVGQDSALLLALPPGAGN